MSVAPSKRSSLASAQHGGVARTQIRGPASVASPGCRRWHTNEPGNSALSRWALPFGATLPRLHFTARSLILGFSRACPRACHSFQLSARFAFRNPTPLSSRCGLTPQSTGPATAGSVRLARSGFATVARQPYAARLRGPVTSNVRPHRQRIVVRALWRQNHQTR